MSALSLAAAAVWVTATPSVAQQHFELLVGVNSHGPSMGAADSLGGAPITEADLLAPYGGALGFEPAGGPGIVLDGGTIGLPLYAGCVGHGPGVSCGIEIDAASTGRARLLESTPGLSWSLHFSVDEYATGYPNSVVPSVRSEFAFGESSADVFTTEFTSPGPLPPPASVPQVPNVAGVDGDGFPHGSYAYLGIGLVEPNLPSGSPPPDTGDDIDTLIADVQVGPATRLYFSLEGGLFDPEQNWTPSDSAALNGNFSGADVLVSDLSGSAPVLYAAAAQLGLGPGDDVDALTLRENGVPGFQASSTPYDWGDGPGSRDLLLFSVRKGSEIIGTPDCLLGLPIQPGDVLTVPCPGASVPGIFVAAEALGLSTARIGGHVDDLNAVSVPKDEMRDCNENGIPDEADIAKGLSEDQNGNGIPDDCEVKITRYCFCVPAVAPCGNADANAGCVNMAGTGGALDGFGSTSVYSDDLLLWASDLPLFQPGIVFMGGAAINVPFVNGRRCVGPGGQGLFRFPPRMSGATGTIGLSNVVGTACALPPVACIEAGERWYFQLWYRDPAGPCNAFSNLTNGVEVEFGL